MHEKWKMKLLLLLREGVLLAPQVVATAPKIGCCMVVVQLSKLLFQLQYKAHPTVGWCLADRHCRLAIDALIDAIVANMLSCLSVCRTSSSRVHSKF